MNKRFLPVIAALAFILATAVVALGVYLSSQGGIRTPLVTAPTAFHVPAASAADAFHIFADKSNASGMEVDSDIKIESKVAVSTTELKQSLRIVPPIDYDLQDNGANSFTLKPRQDLDAGKIYKISLATVVDAESGQSAREYSFALQTAPEFKLVSSIPTDHGTTPQNGGIEFKFTAGGWGDPSPFVSVEPVTPGRWETHGRTLTFIPEKLFEAEKRFQITIKKGFGPAGAKGLDQDLVLHFQTATDYPSYTDSAYLNIMADLYTAPINKPWTLFAYGYGVKTFDAAFYKISKNDLRGLLEQETGDRPWIETEVGDKKYQDLAKNIAVTTTVDLADDGYNSSLHFPAMTPGFYLLHVSAKGHPRADAWVKVQVTDSAPYFVADKDQLYVWMMNAGSGRPLSDMPVTIGKTTIRTDAGGLAKLATPDELHNSATTSKIGVIAEIGSGDTASLALLTRTQGWYGYASQESALNRLWGYLNLDRPLYRNDDQVQFFGLARDRQSDQGVGKVTIRLRRSYIWTDFWTGEDKIYAQTDVQTDPAGRFSGSLSYKDMPAGSYTVEAIQNNEIVSSQMMEIRDYAKPAYNLELSLDKSRAYSGQVVNVTIRARFFDGTPVPRAKLVLSLGREGGADEKPITLDADGLATVKWTVPTWTCRPLTTPDHYCDATHYYYADLRPGEGERGEIRASATLQARSGNLGLDAQAEASQGQGKITVRAYRQDFAAPEDGFKDNWAGRTLDITVIPSWHEKIQTGLSYDPISKTQTPVYTYQQRFDPVIPFRLTTDAQGKIEQTFAYNPDRNYEVAVEGKDDQGRVTRGTTWVWSTKLNQPKPVPTPSIKLEPTTERGTYDLGTQIKATLMTDGTPYQLPEGSRALFFLASRGLQDVTVESSNAHSFRFEKNVMPNTQIGSVIWFNGAFSRLRSDAAFNLDSRKLNIKAKTDKTSYAPGETVHISVTATDPSGAPARDVVFAFSAVDQALLALAYPIPSDPLGRIYGQVEDGIIYEQTTYDAYGMAGGGGGAEMGGGEGFAAKSGVRKNFKDTAAFGTVRTDFGGQADVSFKAPDNLTTWSVDLAGISDTLLAGEATVDVVVNKPLFVSAVVPESMLSKDKPVIKLRAYGTAVKNGEPVTFGVDSPTLGLTNQTVTGTAGIATYVGIDKLVAGTHRITVGVAQGSLDDALEQFVNVADTRYTKRELAQVDAAPGTALPDLGQSEASVIFTSKTKASLLGDYEDLALTDSARVDALLAKRVALRRLDEDFGGRPAGAPTDEQLAALIGSYAYDGYHLLPYSSSDLELSSELVVTAPDLVDQDGMTNYFLRYYDGKDSSKLERIEALAGLAALGSPVLTELQNQAADDKLDWRSLLIVARGLEAAGDRERAWTILNRLLEQSDSRDNLLWLKVSSDPVDMYEATADAAALAARLQHPKAEVLHNWVKANFFQDAFPVLAKLRYLDAIASTAVNRDITLSYTLGDDDKTMTFNKDAIVERLTLTRDEASRFRVTKVDGPITISFIRSVAGRPVSVPELAISRGYSAKIDNLQEGDNLTVTLRPESRGRIQPGCYLIQDHLPAGMKPLLNWTAGDEKGGIGYPVDVSGDAVSFVECIDSYQNGFKPLSYQAFIVSRGTYSAEAPSVANMEYPSISAVGTDAEITIK